MANLEVQIVLSTSVPFGQEPAQAVGVWGDPNVLFRMSFANLVELGKNKLKTHGIWELSKRLFLTRKPEPLSPSGILFSRLAAIVIWQSFFLDQLVQAPITFP